MILASLLASSKYIIVNKDLIQILGLNEAVILGELCSEYTYWANREQLDNDEYFYSTRENIQNNTGITPHFQRIALKNLEEKGIITTKKKGIPCKTFYRIDEVKVIEYLKKAQIIPKNSDVNEVNNKTLTEETTSQKPDNQQDVNDVDINNNNINNNKQHTQANDLLEEKKEYAKQVEMTETEYNDLINTYGEQTANQLIEQLSLYKQAHGKGYESDYAAIKIWVTKRLKEMEIDTAKYDKFKNTQSNTTKTRANFEQREYPPGFFDSLIANNK